MLRRAWRRSHHSLAVVTHRRVDRMAATNALRNGLNPALDAITPPRLARLMTNRAPVRRFPAGMTFHAGDHRDRLLLHQDLALPHRAVADLAANVSFLMVQRMREPHIVRNAIQPHPRHRLLRPRITSQLLNRRAVRLHAGMAPHAGLLSG